MNMERTGGLLKQAVPAATHQRAAGWLFTENRRDVRCLQIIDNNGAALRIQSPVLSDAGLDICRQFSADSR